MDGIGESAGAAARDLRVVFSRLRRRLNRRCWQPPRPRTATQRTDPDRRRARYPNTSIAVPRLRDGKRRLAARQNTPVRPEPMTLGDDRLVFAIDTMRAHPRAALQSLFTQKAALPQQRPARMLANAVARARP